MDDLETIQEEFACADKRMLQLEKDIQKVKQFIAAYSKLNKNLQALEKLYFKEDWLKKCERLEESGKANFAAASQDGIWNLYTEIR